MNQRDVEDLIFAKLAEQSGQDPAQLRAEAEAAGAELPFDSLLVVEILGLVGDHYGIDIPAVGPIAETTGSVARLAAEVLALVRARQISELGEGA
jgi:acyl carrier protein